MSRRRTSRSGRASSSLRFADIAPARAALSEAPPQGAAPFACRGGIRLGAVRHIDADEGIAAAVKIAKQSDGEHLVSAKVYYSDATVPVAILVIGLNQE